MHTPLIKGLLLALNRSYSRAASRAASSRAIQAVISHQNPTQEPSTSAAALAATLGVAATAVYAGVCINTASADAQPYQRLPVPGGDYHLATLVNSQPAFAPSLALTAPLCLLVNACEPLSPQVISSIAQAGTLLLKQQHISSSNVSQHILPTWEMAALARGLALLAGPELQVMSPEFVQELRTSFRTACSGSAWPLQDLISLAWSLSVTAGGLLPDELQALCQCISSHHTHSWDDTSSLLMLDCLLLTAASIGGPSASSASGPRATRDAVAALAASCGPAVQKSLLITYDMYMPLEPYVLVAALVLLHTALCVQHMCNGDSAATSSSSWLSKLSRSDQTRPAQASPPLQGLMSADCMGMAAMAHTLVSNRDSHELARLKRDVHYHWRQDQSIDSRQRAVNEAAYQLGRLLGQQAVSRPPDVDIVLPQSRLALVFTDDSLGSGLKPAFSLALGAQVLSHTCRERLCPRSTYSPEAARGVSLAHDQAAQQLGWRVRRISTREWGQVASKPGADLRAWLNN